MNFELNEDQVALQDSLSRMLAQHFPLDRRRALGAGPAEHDPQAWAALGELGITALVLPVAHGGFGAGARDLLPVMQAFGRALCIEPLLASSVLAARAVALAADDTMQARLLPGVATGESILAFAHDEPGGRHAPLWVETRAAQHNGQWVIDGAKAPVLWAGLAGHAVVSARVSGTPEAAQGCALFLVSTSQRGVDLRRFRLVDGTPAAELQMNGAAAEPLHDPFDSAKAHAAIDGAIALGISAVCSDMVGSMQAAHELTLDYLRTRKQFGRLIGENQALRHRAAEMLVSLEMARSMAIAAAIAVDDPQAEESRRDVHRAKLLVGRQARALAHSAIQLHGGIGMTEEYAVGHHLRRIHVMDQLFGDSDAHAMQLADLY